jgi:hypothetical protein
VFSFTNQFRLIKAVALPQPSSATSAAAAVTNGATAASPPSIDGNTNLKIVPLQYKGPITPGGPIVHLNGTAAVNQPQIRLLSRN